MPITFRQKGSFSKTEKFLERCKNLFKLGILDEYGRKGVNALSLATPIDGGETAASWRYEIVNEKGILKLTFVNDEVTKDGTPIAILIQYGHGTRNGGYVKGRDFINPAIRPVFDELADKLWKEVTK